MKLTFFALGFFFVTAASAQDTAAAAKQVAYRQTVTTRAEKIVASLQLADAARNKRVTQLVANQYVALNALYTVRDERLKAAKQELTDKAALATRTKEIEDALTPQLQKVHDAFLKQLAKELSPEQVVKIKDGMTYNVLPITYTAFLDMIPALKPAEKDQIMAWLLEAREHAMDAESSERKHRWFGKYKGRINNYLAAQGYDLQKERQGWEQRQKEREEQKKATPIH